MHAMTKLGAALAIGFAATAGAARADDIPSADKSFMEKAAQAGFTEVEGSKLAATKAASAQVKAFADQMIKDHTAAGDKLTALAGTKGVKLPTEPGVTQKAKLKLLATKDGADFDQQYAKTIGVSAHKDTVALFKKEAADGKDADVKAFAAATLPTLEHHLTEANTLVSSLPRKTMKTNGTTGS